MLTVKRKGFYGDLSVWTLIACNLGVIVWALVEGWSWPTVLWVYWSESVGIGLVWFVRIISLEAFTTKGLVLPNNKPMAPTRGAKILIAGFFLALYGLFHFAYAEFLAGVSDSVAAGTVVLAGAGFLASEIFAFFYNRKSQSREKPNLGKLMFFPYARIVPMQITIILASILADRCPSVDARVTLVVFLSLKTVADVGMYVRQLKGFADKPSSRLDDTGPLTQLLAGKRQARKDARKIRDLMKKVYVKEHEHRVVDAAEFRHLDLKYYARIAGELKANGFTMLGDIEDLTIRRAHPQLRTFIRCLANDDGTIVAGIFHVGFKGWLKVCQLLGVVRSPKAFEFETEFSNGCFLLTSNTKSGLAPPPQIMTEYLPSDASVVDLLRAHEKRVAEYLAQNADVHPVAIRSIQGAIECANRQNAIVSAYRAPMDGMLLEEEMDEIAGPQAQERGEDVLYEMEKLQDSPEQEGEEVE